MNRISLSLIILMILMAKISFAQTGDIKGIIYSGSFQSNAKNVVVSLKGTDFSTTSNDVGAYQISAVPEGKYTLIFNLNGYTEIKKQVSVFSGKVSEVSINIERNVLSLKEVTINPKDSNGLNKDKLDIVNQIDIKLRPVNSSQDLLRLVPGLFIAQHAGGGKAEQIFLRGFDSDHGTDFATFVDGMPINMISHAHGQGYADMHFIIPEAVDKLEVYKGPYQAKYGDFATSGAGEFKTKNFLQKNEVKVEAGSFNTFRMMSMFNLLNNDQHLFSKLKENFYFAGEYRYTDAYFTNPQNFYRYNLFTKYYGLLTPNTSLTFSASHFGSKWNASGQIPTLEVEAGRLDKFGSIDPTEGGNTDRTNINAIVEHKINDHQKIKNQMYYSHYDFNLFSNFTFFASDSIKGDGINQRDKRNILGYLGSFESKDNIGSTSLTSIFGATLRYDMADVSLRKAFKRELLDTFASGKLNQTNAAIYYDGNLQITPKFRMNAGTRMDVFNFNYQNRKEIDFSGNSVKTRISPKLNFFYDVNQNFQLNIKSGIGFHSNDARAVIINKVQNTNQNMLPRAYGTEIGSVFKINKMIFSVAFWTLDLENQLIYVGDDGNVEQAGRTRRTGVDFGMRYQIIGNWYFDADINYNHGRLLDAPKGENRIPLAPIITSIAGISYKASKGLNGSLRYRYMGDRPANEDNSLTAKGYFILDAIINYTKPRYNIGLSAENLTNVYWREAQFATDYRLLSQAPTSNICYTPGTPFSIKGSFSLYF